jgi:hypothetical protein
MDLHKKPAIRLQDYEGQRMDSRVICATSESSRQSEESAKAQDGIDVDGYFRAKN